MNIVKSITRDPERPSTTITFEDDTKWIRPCEGGCGKQMTEDKVIWRTSKRPGTSKSGFDPEEVVEVTRTAPSAGRCITCGPFPKS